MGSCKKYSEKITELALGGLSAAEAAEIEAHAAQCPDCAALLAETRELVGALKSAELPEPRAEFTAGLADSVHDELKGRGAESMAGGNVAPMRRGGAGMLKALAALAAMLVLALGLMIVMRGMQGGDSPVAGLTDQDVLEEIAALQVFDDGSDVSLGIEVEDAEMALDGDLGIGEIALAMVVEDADLAEEDLEWLETGLGDSGEYAEADFESFFENMTEEEAREILESLEEASPAQTSLPGGVS